MFHVLCVFLLMQHNTKCDCSKTNGLYKNEVNVVVVVVVFFSIKYFYSDILLKNT